MKNLKISAIYMLVPAGMMTNSTITMVVPANENPLCILNSKLADYYIRNNEKETDREVYELYGLMKDEIAFIENLCLSTKIDCRS